MDVVIALASDRFVIFNYVTRPGQVAEGQYQTYSDYDDIPETFDKLIACQFAPLPEPHSEEDHAMMATWNDKLQALKARQS